MNLRGSIRAFGEHPPREQDVLPGVRRAVLLQDPALRHAHAHGDARELIGFRFVPEVLRDRAEAAGEDEQRRPALEEQLRGALGDDGVVAAEREDHIGAGELVIQLMVAPDLLDQGAYAFVHLRVGC
jgi:hypothetical protein